MGSSLSVTTSLSLIKSETTLPWVVENSSAGIVAFPDVDVYGNAYLPSFLNPSSDAGSGATLGSLWASSLSIWNNFRDSGSTTSQGTATNQKLGFCADNYGVLHLFCYAPTVSNNTLNHYTYFNGVWQKINGYTIPTTSFNFVVKMGSGNVISLLVMDVSNYYLLYTTISSSGVIGSFTTILNTGRIQLYADMYIDASGVVHVAADNGIGLSYMKSSNNWSVENVGVASSNNGGSVPKLVVGSDGQVHIVATLSVSGSTWYLFYAYRDTLGSWHASTQLSGSTVLQTPSISIDQNNFVYCSYQSGGGPYSLYLFIVDNLGNLSSPQIVNTSSYIMYNLNFFNPNAYPIVNGAGNGAGVPLSGAFGIFQLTSSDANAGYWLWQTNNLVRPTYAPVPPTPTPPSVPCNYQTGGTVRKLVSSISGLSYLNGELVSVASDGSFVDTYTVNNGTIILNRPAATIHVGLAYNGTLRFLPLGGDGQDVNQGKDRKPYDFILRVWKSLSGKFGQDLNNLFSIDYSESVNKNPDDDVLFTGDIHYVPTESSWDNYCQPELVVTEPLPFMLLAAIIRSEISEDK